MSLERECEGVVLANPGGNVLVTLDANHESEGLLVELMLYAPLVTVGSYLVVQGGRISMLFVILRTITSIIFPSFFSSCLRLRPRCNDLVQLLFFNFKWLVAI